MVSKIAPFVKIVLNKKCYSNINPIPFVDNNTISQCFVNKKEFLNFGTQIFKKNHP